MATVTVTDAQGVFETLLKLDTELTSCFRQNLMAYRDLRLIYLEKSRRDQISGDEVILMGSSSDGTASARFFKKAAIPTLEGDLMFAAFSFPPEIAKELLSPAPGLEGKGYYRIRKDPRVAESLVKVFKSDNKIAKLDTVFNSSPGEFISGMMTKAVLEDIVRLRDNSGMIKQFMAHILNANIGDLSHDAQSSFNGPAVTIEVDLLREGKKFLLVSVDISCCVQLSPRPTCELELSQWANRERCWPDESVIEQILKAPVHLVPKPSDKGLEHADEWRLSFVNAEQCLVKERTEAMGLAYFAFKVVFYSHLKEREVEGEGLPSYLAKTTMMWACEELPPEHWEEQSLQENVQFLLIKLQSYVEAGHVPYYFVPEINLISRTDKRLLQPLLAPEFDAIVQEPLGSVIGANVQDVMETIVTYKDRLSRLQDVFALAQTLPLFQ